jgi:hypothetical protein
MSSAGLSIRKGSSTSRDPAQAAQDLHDAIWQPNIAFATFYCAADYDLPALGAEIAKRFGDVNLVGCTTAGEITPEGYVNGALTGLSIAGQEFRAVTHRFDGLQGFELSDGEKFARDLVSAASTRGEVPTPADSFALLLIDGLSNREEAVVSTLSRALRGISLFGGSAADGTRFAKTFLYHAGEFRTDVALLTLVTTTSPFMVFKTQHFVPSSEKMVITGADPARRIVTEINGEPAGREYARVVGLEVDELTPLIFSAHPVVVQVGGVHYVRSIQKVNDDESLTFFCAIDEGIVLTVARGIDMAQNLASAFDEVRAKIGMPELVIGCDCILRHLEIEQKELRAAMSRILVDNNVVGFSTYGEQFNAMHVNQTFTGVAIGAAR